LSKCGPRTQKEQEFPSTRSNGGRSRAARPLTNIEHPEA